jgi:hypothetical protein
MGKYGRRFLFYVNDNFGDQRMSKVEYCTLCVWSSCMFLAIDSANFLYNFMLSITSDYACFVSSLWYTYCRCTVISFTVWPVYAINNALLCMFAHTFMIQLSPFYARKLFLFCLKCMIQLSLFYTGNISFCIVMLHSLTSLCITQRRVTHICTYMYAK